MSNEIRKKYILITGANSYIGESVEKWLKKTSSNYHITTLDMLNSHWRDYDFSQYDVVYHVAGIAHADVGNVSDEVKEKYYKVNRDLALEVANISKNSGVKQFIFMSSMIVYSGCKETLITRNTKPKAENFYGDSKLQADLALQKLNDETFKVCIIRPPMIYGKGSKGNYPLLVKLATKLPVFPNVKNRRSMLHIDNLCEFIRFMIDNEEVGVFFPQNAEYTNTSEMVKMIAKVNEHKIIMVPGTNSLIHLMTKLPGKIGTLAKKAFGNSAYDMSLSNYTKGNYRIHSLLESIQATEDKNAKDSNKKAIIIASVASMIDQFNRDNIHLLQELDYEVHVACNFDNAGTITNERMKKLKSDLDEMGVKYFQVPIPRKLSNIKDMIVSLKILKKLANKNQYKIMHCHSPIGGVIARLAFNACRKNRITKVIYTAHGFHFYKGAPIKNWIIFYPIEKLCSRITDVLITINHDDYDFAKKHMKANKVKYVPGIGINLDKFKLKDFDKNDYRTKLGLKVDDFMILSVGELNKNKNHEVVIKAIANLRDSNIHYFIAGKGDLKDRLITLSKELNVENQIHLLGYRTDIDQLCNSTDVYILPSIREGLNVSLMEAMASGTPCIGGDIRGNRDLIQDNENGFLCNPLIDKEFSDAISKLKNNTALSCVFQMEELKTIKKFSNVSVRRYMKSIYKEGMNN
ncbi:glycosyltransferase [uncultured Catenibacterium sp.]|uniref:glycosyltransferase n=1 Tax=uncultured Catenibacterium sp. TaxID=286142 RepID=UPI0025D75C1E|nr:glycosyltransferase [uncultured Catenibacterium sp.]